MKQGLLLILLSACFLTVSACGKKSDLKPPSQSLATMAYIAE